MTTPPRRRSPGRNRSGLRSVAHRPSPRPVDTSLRTGIIYRFPVWEIDANTGLINLYDEAGQRTGATPDLRLPHTGRPRIVYDYIGQTVRGLDVREAEHVEDKPWADLIAGPAEEIERGLWDKTTRDLKEIAAIHVLAPRFNYDHNLDNPSRIEIWRQVELRHARDRAAGRPLWLPPAQRTALAQEQARLDVVQGGLDGREPRYPVDVIGSVVVAFWRWLPAGLRRGLAIVAGGLLAALAGTALLVDTGWPVPAAAGLSAATAGSLTVALLRRRRRRRRRRH